TWLVAVVLMLALAIVAASAIARVANNSTDSRAATSTGTTAERALSPSFHGDQSAAIAGLQLSLKDNPDNAAAWATLGLDYVDQARVTVDPAYDTKAEGALAKSIALNNKDNFIADAGEASLAAARHQFAS